MLYDKNKLIALRESIDAYLVKEGQQDLKIYETLEKSITAGVAEGVKQAMSEVTTKLDKILEKDI
jgi:hypothetical protein